MHVLESIFCTSRRVQIFNAQLFIFQRIPGKKVNGCWRYIWDAPQVCPTHFLEQVPHQLLSINHTINEIIRLFITLRINRKCERDFQSKIKVYYEFS